MERFDLGFYVPVQLNDSDDLKARLEILQEMGINHFGTDGFCGWQDGKLTDSIAKVINDTSFTLQSFHAPFGLMFPDPEKLQKSLDDNKRIIDIAASWGAKNIVWHARWFRGNDGDTHFAQTSVMDEMKTERIDDLMMKVLPATCEYAARFGININIENLPLFKWARDSYDLFSFIRSADIANFGFIYDIGHAWCSGYDPAEIIREAGPLLNDTHFHDNLGILKYDLSKTAVCDDVPFHDLHLIPGLGTINWIDVIRALHEIAYPNPIIFEGPHLRGVPGKNSLKAFERSVGLTIQNWRAFEDLEEHLELQE